MSYSQINCFNACVMNPIGSPIIDHPSQISYPKNGSLLLKKHHSQGISPGDVGLLFSFPFWSQLAMSRLHSAAVTGKEERHASEAHVAPTEARGAAGGCVDLWVCVQVIHTWACENNHGFSGKPMKSQKKTSRHHQKKCFWRCLLPHLELKRGSLKHLLPPLLVSIFPTLDVHHNLLSSRSFKCKMGEGMRRIPVGQSWWYPQVNTLRSGSHGRLWPGWLND